MTFISIVETFGAVVVAFGGFEGVKWVIRRYAPKKNEKRLDESEAGKSEIEVQQAVQDLKDSINETWQKNIKEFTEIDTARIKELREANTIVNNQNTELNNRITDLLKAGARKDEIISDKTNKIRELEEARICITKEYEEKITHLTRQLGHQEKLTMFYRAWHCEREYGKKKENCMRRKPAQEPPLKYCPPELAAIAVVETDPLLVPECNDCNECKPKAAKTKTKTAK